MATAAVLVAEHKEWPFHGVLRRTRIGDDTMFNLEFKLPSILEHLNLPINPEALAICSSREALSKPLVADEAATHSKIYQALSRPPKKRALWTSEEDAALVKMRGEKNCSWKEICAALPNHPLGSIQVRYSTKFSSGKGSRKRQR